MEARRRSGTQRKKTDRVDPKYASGPSREANGSKILFQPSFHTITSSNLGAAAI